MRGRCPKPGAASLQVGAASPNRRDGQDALVYPQGRILPYPLFGFVMRAKTRLVTKATAPKTAMAV